MKPLFTKIDLAQRALSFSLSPWDTIKVKITKRNVLYDAQKTTALLPPPLKLSLPSNPRLFR